MLPKSMLEHFSSEGSNEDLAVVDQDKNDKTEIVPSVPEEAAEDHTYVSKPTVKHMTFDNKLEN